MEVAIINLIRELVQIYVTAKFKDKEQQREEILDLATFIDKISELLFGMHEKLSKNEVPTAEGNQLGQVINGYEDVVAKSRISKERRKELESELPKLRELLLTAQNEDEFIRGVVLNYAPTLRAERFQDLSRAAARLKGMSDDLKVVRFSKKQIDSASTTTTVIDESFTPPSNFTPESQTQAKNLFKEVHAKFVEWRRYKLMNQAGSITVSIIVIFGGAASSFLAINENGIDAKTRQLWGGFAGALVALGKVVGDTYKFTSKGETYRNLEKGADAIQVRLKIMTDDPELVELNKKFDSLLDSIS